MTADDSAVTVSETASPKLRRMHQAMDTGWTGWIARQYPM